MENTPATGETIKLQKKTMRKTYLNRCEAILTSYHEQMLSECDIILGEILAEDGNAILQSKNPSKYALAIIELAYQRQRGRANMCLMQRLSGQRGKNTLAHGRSCIREFYESRHLTYIPIQRKNVPFFEKIKRSLRGGMEEVG